MISVEEAILKVNSFFYKGKPISKPLSESLNYILAEDILSGMDMPPFPQSAMDGYAVKMHDDLSYSLVGEIKAGDQSIINLNPGEAVRIFTGAAVPSTANAVIMQEKTSASNGVLTLIERPKLLENIRPQGEQIHKGELALPKGSLLSPSAISYIASLGVTQVSVYPKAKVAIVVTGSELVSPGEELPYGKIYESNSILLATTLEKEGILDYKVFRVEDNYESTKLLLDQLTLQYDFVLVSGGISVGDYDFVGKSLKEIGTKEIFYKIKQKPGKPLFFGKRNTCLVFALPGNPASALTCFYIYALPILRFYSGNKKPHLPKVTCKLSHDYQVKGIRAQFLKAIVKGDEVKVLTQQSSAMISGFIEANAYVFVPENSGLITKGTAVQVILLP